MQARIIAFGIALVACLPFPSSAQSLADLNAQIEALIQQVTVIETQLGVPTFPSPSPTPSVSITTSNSSSGCLALSRIISLGASGSDVSALQRFLVSQGLLSSSPTGYFGELTRTALQNFQARNGIISSGTAATTGYGATGPRTRALIQSLSCGSSGTIRPIATPSPVPLSGAGVPCIVGSMGVASGAFITLYDAPSSSGVCRAQARQCINGSLTGDAQFRFTSCSVSNVAQDRCRLGGETLLNGESATFYEDSKVDLGESCSEIAQERTCRDGKLSGSARYKYSSCRVDKGDRCEIDSVTLSHDSSRTFFSKKVVPFGEACSTYAISRTCEDGELTGSSDFQYATCAPAISNDCSLDGASVKNGVSKVFYASRTVAYGGTCDSQSRLCTKGILGGNAQYQYATCTAAAAGSCTYNGQSVAHGAEKRFYKSSSVAFGQSCDVATNIKNRKCNNGSWDGDSQYPHSSCSVGGQPAASCTLSTNTSTVLPNTSLTFSWTTKNATAGTLFGSSIASVPSGSRLFGGYSSTGEKTVELSVSGPGGAGQCSTKVLVQNTLPPTCTLKYKKHTSATVPTTAAIEGPATVTYADYLTLVWTSDTATSYASSSSSIGSSNDITTNVLSGSYTLKPRDGSYTYTFKNAGGTKQCTLNVNYAAPTCGTINSNKSSYLLGELATLTYSSTNADYATATSSDRILPNGSVTVKLEGGTNTFNFVFRGLGGQKTCTKVITVPTPLKVNSPSSGSYNKDSEIGISWQYTSPAASTRVYLALVDLNGNQVGSPIFTGLAASTDYVWKVQDSLGGTTIKNGEYKIRAVAYNSTGGCSATLCPVLTRAESGTITLNTGIAGSVVQNLANALSAIESALVTVIRFLQ